MGVCPSQRAFLCSGPYGLYWMVFGVSYRLVWGCHVGVCFLKWGKSFMRSYNLNHDMGGSKLQGSQSRPQYSKSFMSITPTKKGPIYTGTRIIAISGQSRPDCGFLSLLSHKNLHDFGGEYTRCKRKVGILPNTEVLHHTNGTLGYNYNPVTTECFPTYGRTVKLSTLRSRSPH